MMKMYFFFGELMHFLFKSWALNSPGKIFGAVVFAIVLAILYELLKTFRELLIGYHENRKKKAQYGDLEARKDETEALLPTTNSGVATVKTVNMKLALKQYISPLHIVQSLLQVLQVGLGYVLMLVAMTFNAYLFLAVCIGAGIGYYLFAGFRRSVFSFREQSEHCH